MKLSTLQQLLPRESEICLSPEGVKTICGHVIQHFDDDDGLGMFFDFASDDARKMIQELLAELPLLEQKKLKGQFSQTEKRHTQAMRDRLKQQLSKIDEHEKQEKQNIQKTRAAAAAEEADRIAKRRQQIIDAITQTSKQSGLTPLALVHCGSSTSHRPGDNCPEPATTLWLSSVPESDCLNFDHIVNAFCSQHWRGRGGDGWPLHWHDMEFLHPAVSTVCIEKKALHKSWTRNPEKFGKRVRTAKDRINNTIRCGALVTYDSPLGDPRQGAHTENAFGRVERIWQVGTIKVLQLRKIIFRYEAAEQSLVIAKPTLKMSPRLSTKYAEKVIVLPEIPKLFRKVLA